jgi:hypothetical protein
VGGLLVKTDHPAVFKHNQAAVAKKPVFFYATTVGRSIYRFWLTPGSLHVPERHADSDSMIENQEAEIVLGPYGKQFVHVYVYAVSSSSKSSSNSPNANV